jgi:PglZ domain
LGFEEDLGSGEAFSFGLMLPALFGANEATRLKSVGGITEMLGVHFDLGAAASLSKLIETDGGPILEGLTMREARQRLDSAAQFVERFQLTDWIEKSSILPGGYEARIRMFSECLQDALKELTAGAATRLEDSALAIHKHRDAGSADGEKRARVFSMAARAYRWLLTPAEAGGFVDSAVGYLNDGSWVDVTWRALWLGDTDAASSQSLSVLASRIAERQRANYLRFASALSGSDQTATSATGIELVPVERVLERVVAPLARVSETLLIVLDGYALSVHNQVMPGMVAHGWSPIAPLGVTGRVGVAMLPTVTHVSRASLLAGAALVGTMDAERSAFAVAPAFAGLQREGLLFHQRDLAGTAGQALADNVVRAIDGHERVVGVVVNTVDDTLAKGTFPSLWDLDAIPFLRELLRVAAQARRAVVITADHGHLVQQEMMMRPPTESGGERWRPASGPAASADEIRVMGPRVLQGDGAVIMPWADDLRYAPKKGGYHGGASPAEVLVPLVVLTHDEVPEGWAVVGSEPPAWWSGREPEKLKAVTVLGVRAKKPARQDTKLFDLDVAVPSAAPLTSKTAWVSEVLDSELWIARSHTRSLRLNRAQLEDLFDAFHKRAGVLNFGVVAEITGTIVGRVQGLLAAIAQQCNADGFAILTTDPVLGEARLDVPLFRIQFLGASGGKAR